jgi:hypothetical protein
LSCPWKTRIPTSHGGTPIGAVAAPGHLVDRLAGTCSLRNGGRSPARKSVLSARSPRAQLRRGQSTRSAGETFRPVTVTLTWGSPSCTGRRRCSRTARWSTRISRSHLTRPRHADRGAFAADVQVDRSMTACPPRYRNCR